MSEHMIQTIPELERYAREFLEGLVVKKQGATVVGLSGDLGSGKTAFVKAIAKALEVNTEIVSPTFVIAKFYNLPAHSTWSRLVHVDAYRIEDPEEVRVLKWEDILADPKNLVMIEWPQQIGTFFPHDAELLAFRFIDETTRAITSNELSTSD